MLKVVCNLLNAKEDRSAEKTPEEPLSHFFAYVVARRLEREPQTDLGNSFDFSCLIYSTNWRATQMGPVYSKTNRIVFKIKCSLSLAGGLRKSSLNFMARTPIDSEVKSVVL